jgi:catechol 2,3-dioxygenase-like lactoylglutathione lyase family enzyme
MSQLTPSNPTMSEPTIEPMSFDHVGLSVASLDVSRRFYGEVLGFRTVEDCFALPAHEIKGLILLNGQGVRIELFQREGSQPGRTGHPTEGALTQGYFQFALSVTDIHATFARVVAAGAKPVLSPRIAPDGRALFAFIADPDGNLVEFLQRPVQAPAESGRAGS